jgi:hypothetical protein
VRPALAIVLAAVAVLAAATPAYAGKPPTALRVVADADGSGPERAETLRVTCRSSGDRRRACRILRRLPREVFSPREQPEVCTQQWGGPQTARVVGRLRGRQIDLRFDLADGCAISQWELAAPLLELTGVRPGVSAPELP